MKTQTVLTVDVGNTRAKFGIFSVTDSLRPKILANTAVQLADSESPGTDLVDWIRRTGQSPDIAIVAGSNPPVRDLLLNNWPRNLPSPDLIDTADRVPITIDVDSPQTVGIDRLLTAHAASRLYASGAAAIVVDSGTATTVNLVTRDGVFRGGAILPGLRLSAHSLHDYTARLPFIVTDQLGDDITNADLPLPGRTTREAITAGLFWGQLGAIREIRDRLSRTLRDRFHDEDPAVCLLTGGGGRQLARHLEPCQYVDSLALHGLVLLAEIES